MNNKTIINQRFIEAVNFVISEKYAKNKSEISEKLNIQKSKFSEILNGRMSVGLEDLANFIDIYNISPMRVLLGEGEMLRSKASTLNEPTITYNTNNEVIEALKEVIAAKEETIQSLKEQLEQYKSLKGKISATN